MLRAMPMIDVTFPADTLTSADKQRLGDELTTHLLRAERAPDTEFFRSITWVFLHELPSGDLLVAGKPVTAPVVRVEVTTPEGALSDRRRAELVDSATTAVRDVFGIAQEDALKVWVVCREIADGSWGAGGQVVRFQQLREAAAAARGEEGAAFERAGAV
jgi:phenylpyruvate tautomerase PptA (4-oxalocrotonate tautomerase family)